MKKVKDLDAIIGGIAFAIIFIVGALLFCN